VLAKQEDDRQYRRTTGDTGHGRAQPLLERLRADWIGEAWDDIVIEDSALLSPLAHCRGSGRGHPVGLPTPGTAGVTRPLLAVGVGPRAKFEAGPSPLRMASPGATLPAGLFVKAARPPRPTTTLPPGHVDRTFVRWLHAPAAR
jgi:hypothetical protein